MSTLFDFNDIIHRMDMDKEDIVHLMTVYEPELHKDFEELIKNASDEGWDSLSGKLHKMKGDAANLCLTPLSSLLARMEETAAEKNRKALAKQICEAERIGMQLFTEFKKFTDSRKD